jgi:predicted regulator of Ras-like GTPase activity (Roadblock/LC7/MglB family)
MNKDLNIEASSIIKTDGTILASAISSRISDSLFATIGMNLSMIGTDIIEGLDAGTLKSISVRGTDGVLDLAPIDRENPSVKDMILVIFSHPRVKSGIISFAVNIVKKQLLDYLG